MITADATCTVHWLYPSTTMHQPPHRPSYPPPPLGYPPSPDIPLNPEASDPLPNLIPSNPNLLKLILTRSNSLEFFYDYSLELVKVAREGGANWYRRWSPKMGLSSMDLTFVLLPSYIYFHPIFVFIFFDMNNFDKRLFFLKKIESPLRYSFLDKYFEYY